MPDSTAPSNNTKKGSRNIAERGEQQCPKDTGSPTSRCARPIGTPNTSPPPRLRIKKYGANFVVRGGRFEDVEGNARTRPVVIEFPDYDAALACYNSPEYAEARAIRQSIADAEVLVIEGV